MRMHLEVEATQEALTRVDRYARQWQDEVRLLQMALHRLAEAWRAPGAEDFLAEARTLMRKLEQAGDELAMLAFRGRREVEQWIQVAVRLEGVPGDVVEITPQELVDWAADQLGVGGTRALDPLDRGLVRLFDSLFALVPEGDWQEVYVQGDVLAKVLLNALGLPVFPGLAGMLGTDVTWRLRRTKDGKLLLSRSFEGKGGIGLMDPIPGVQMEVFVSEAQEIELTWTFDPNRPHEMKALALAMLYPSLLSPDVHRTRVVQALPLPSGVKEFFETLTPTSVAVRGGIQVTGRLDIPGGDIDLKEKDAVFVGMEIRRHPDSLDGGAEIRQTLLVQMEGGGELGPLGHASGTVGMRLASQAEVTLVQSAGRGAFVEVYLQLEGEEQIADVGGGVEIAGTMTRGRELVLRIPLERMTFGQVLDAVRKQRWEPLLDAGASVEVMETSGGEVEIQAQVDLGAGEVNASGTMGFTTGRKMWGRGEDN